jgi:hypothetical protein
MRNYMSLMENTGSLPFTIDLDFCREVHAYLGEHLADWQDDYADPAVLAEALRHTVDLIVDQGQPDGPVMEVYRAELRPQAQIESLDFGSFGACWSWDMDGAKVLHHDNGWDDHGKDAKEIIIVGEVALTDVDWVQTMAKNLILRNE